MPCFHCVPGTLVCPPSFSERLGHYKENLLWLLYVQLLKGNPERHFIIIIFIIIIIIIITVFHIGCHRETITAMSRAPSALAVGLTAARAQNPPEQPAIPKCNCSRSKGPSRAGIHCWMFRVMVFKADASVGSWAPASSTSSSIAAKS